jgi:N-methylhydantoinase B
MTMQRTAHADAIDAVTSRERYGYDLVDLETMRYGLIEIARDMMETLTRGAFSPVVRDIRDCTACIHMRTDAGWEMVASWEGCLQHAFTSQHIVNFTMAEWDESTLRPGDCIWVNDPWRGSVHGSDVNVLRPIFVDGKVEMILHTTSHVVDLGGPTPGGFIHGVETAFEEPPRYPPMLLYAEGVPVRPAFNQILENNRVPGMVLGDLRALAGSLAVGESRMQDFIGRYGYDKICAGALYGMDITEAAMRSGIRALPDGDYRAEDIIDDDGIVDEPIPLVVTVMIRGDEVELDWSGSARQPRGTVGTAWCDACRVLIGAKMMIDPSSPVNSGTLRPFNAVMPAGSIICVLPPSSCSDHVEMGGRTINLLTDALSQAMPDKAVGADTGHAGLMNLSGIDSRPGREGTPWGGFALPGGGWGATWKGDGLSACLTACGNVRTSVLEHVEGETPLRIWIFELMPDSAGAGEHRGGFGGVYTFEALADVHMTLSGDRARVGTPGVMGGGPGMPFYAWINEDFDPDFATEALDLRGWIPLFGMLDEDQLPKPDGGSFSKGTRYRSGKVSNIVLPAGHALRVIIGGGGGWGDPLRRDPEKALRDVEDRLNSVAFTRDAYGVVIEDGAVDTKATDALRAQLRADRDADRWHVPTACPPHWITDELER